MSKRADWWLWAAAVGGVALMAARAVSVFHQGALVFTSGMEEESLFAVWKAIHGQAVYGNAFAPPFAQSYFNWLFYWVYGAVCSTVGADGFALPSVARGISLGFAVLAGVAAYLALESLPVSRRWAGAAIVAFNPLVGFWALTARPDVGALAFALVGLWCVRRAGDRLLWLAGAFAALYCSWAFKQTYVVGFVAVILHFALARRWRLALGFGVSTVAAIGITFALATPEYRYAFLGAQKHMAFLPSLLGRNVVRAVLKAPLLVLGLGAAVVCLRRDRTNLLAWWGVLSMPLMMVASAKLGASENYYFEPASVCAILFLREGRRVEWAGLGQALSPLLIALGLVGVMFATPEPELLLLRRGLADLPGPVLVAENGGNLPWFQTRAPHLVVASTYSGDRELGLPFAFGGLRGMMESGRIAVLVCRREQVNEAVDGVLPASLRKLKDDGYWVYFATR